METKRHLRQVIKEKEKIISLLYAAYCKSQDLLQREMKISSNMQSIAYNNIQENRSIKDLLKPIFDKMGYKL